MPSTRRTLLVLVAVALVAASLAAAAARGNGVARPLALKAAPSLFFDGDFETGDLSQWQHVERGGGTDRPGSGVVRAVPTFGGRAGRYVGELTVTPTAHASPAASSDSVFLWNAATPYFTQGSEVWEHFAVEFPNGAYNPSLGLFNWFVEHHNDDGYLRFTSRMASGWWEFPSLAWDVWSTGGDVRMKLRVMGGSDAAPQTTFADGGTLQFDHWYDFVVHVVWQPDARALTQWWLDGRLVYSGNAPNLYTRPDGTVSYGNFELANYRAHANTSSTIYFDDVRIGPTAASIGIPPTSSTWMAASPAQEWQALVAGPSGQYEWQRCDASGQSCSPVAGVTGPRYVTSAVDVGAIVRGRPVGASSWQSWGPVAVYAGYRG